jgi:hypothetical protein
VTRTKSDIQGGRPKDVESIVSKRQLECLMVNVNKGVLVVTMDLRFGQSIFEVRFVEEPLFVASFDGVFLMRVVVVIMEAVVVKTGGVVNAVTDSAVDVRTGIIFFTHITCIADYELDSSMTTDLTGKGMIYIPSIIDELELLSIVRVSQLVDGQSVVRRVGQLASWNLGIQANCQTGLVTSESASGQVHVVDIPVVVLTMTCQQPWDSQLSLE